MVTPFSLRRRMLALGGAGAALGLAGCAADPVPVARAAADPVNAVLRPWLSLNGAWQIDPASPLQVQRPAPARVNFMRPVGVAARNDIVLIADAGERVIWRMDRARDAVARVASFPGSIPEAGTSMQLGNDLSVWVALPTERAVAQYDLRGRLVRRWADTLEAPRPVAVVVPEDRSEVLVGDGASARVVVFDPLGHPRHVLGGNRPPALQSIAAMALGPRGLYVLDRIAQQVVVLAPSGAVVEVIGEHQLVQPRALAVDASGRVFVSDEQEQRIKVFREGRLLASVGGAGGGPARFGRIESMAIDGNLLYVADSLNARVQVMMVSPPSMEVGMTPP